MDVSIIEIDDNSKYLQEVIQLGDTNKDTLGFLPHKAFKEAARQRKILVAITPKGTCVGYVLYRVVKTKMMAAITHLCVDVQHRGDGIAQKLIEHLKQGTRHLRGISLFCKRDYQSNNFWPNVGFRYIGEKSGRGKDQAPLTHYWYEHQPPPLFGFIKDNAETKAVQAIIDANIFIYLFDDSNHPLLSDWLLDDLGLQITAELYNEIHREKRPERRRAMLKYAKTFLEAQTDAHKNAQISELIRPCFPIVLSEQDKSDLRQISHAIVAEADFFVTNDQQLVSRVGQIVFNNFGLSLVTPDDLIIYIDELLNKSSYQSHRLAGSPLQIKRVSSGEGDPLSEIFHRHSGEKKSQFKKKLGWYLARPQEYQTFQVLTEGQNSIAVLSLRYSDLSLDIPFIRVIQSSLSPAMESQLLFWAVSSAIQQEKYCVQVTDKHFTSEMEIALKENSFARNSSGTWVKFNIVGARNTQEIVKTLQEYAKGVPQYTDRLIAIRDELLDAMAQQNISQLISVEKSLWPLKITDAKIPTYIVPIKPTWAIDLFDSTLGSQTLFGSDPALILRMDNAYYRSSRPKFPTAPSRILWYISQGKIGKNYGVMAVRACSYVDETRIGTPKILFKLFGELGVYRWQNVLNVANDNLEKEILAFRFSRTELFDTAVPLRAIMEITHQHSPPFSPRKITNEVFVEIYETGTRKRSP
jgi:GNAT superfamily N-acetyltransferase/predicted nucleic acid-binding protein